MNTENEAEISDDIIVGGANISKFLYGDQKKRRRVYHLAERKELPIFWLGGIMHARKSVLRAAIAAKERDHKV